MRPRERFLYSCEGRPVDRAPVWVMRQAGRYLPEYRAIKERHSFQEMCRTPELAREVTLQPLRRFPLDAAILFSDILVVPEALGIEVEYREGGPLLRPFLRQGADLAKLVEGDVTPRLDYVAAALTRIRKELGEDRALLGFAGAPFTLAVYMIEGGGGKNFREIKRALFERPAFVHALLERLTQALIPYLLMQLRSGADAVQLFDTWAGELSPAEFRRFALPYVKRIARAVKEEGAPLIYYVNGSGGLIEAMSESEAAVLGIDWRVDLGEARRRSQGRFPLQGNLDPHWLFAEPGEIRSAVLELRRGQKGAPHILNLGHGIFPDTPLAGMEAFVAAAHELLEDA